MINVKAIVKRTALFGAVILVYELLLFLLGIHCPFADYLGIKCPTCGVSRALMSLLSLDFHSSFNYHPLAVPLVIACFLIINAEYLKHRKTACAVGIAILVLNFALYVYRLF